MNQHVSMFKEADNKIGYIQCVISFAFKAEFEGLGFVDSVDKITTRDVEAEHEEKELAHLESLREQAKALKVKGWARMSPETLEKAIEKASAANAYN